MEIITFNVGQGCFAVVRDDDEAIVVDTRIPGRDDRSSEFVKAALAKSVAGRNVRGLILTGFDRDHSDARGVSMVLNRYHPDWIMYPRYWKDSEAADDVFEVVERVKARRAKSGKALRRIGVRIDDRTKRFFSKLCSKMTFECFSPHPEDMDTSNNCSLVVKVQSPGLSYLVTGDTENPRWRSINRIFGDAIKSDVMAAPHHGSRNAANAETLSLVDPHTILVSAGIDSQFGHPHPEAMDLFERHAWQVHSTSDGYSLWTRRVGRKLTTSPVSLT